MMNFKKPFLNTFVSILLPVSILVGVVYTLIFQPNDISLNQNEKRHVFGATFMTMNNPYFS